MTNLTRILLIALRLTIGWLFLVEGYEKVTAVQPWSSAGYLQQSSGPLSSFFAWQAGGNADAQAIERLTVRPLGPGEDPATPPPHERASPALKRDWEEHLQRCADHYGFDERQLQEAQGKLDQALDNAVNWILDNKTTKETTKTGAFPTAPYTAKETPAQRIEGYRAKLEEARRAQDEAMPAFGKDIYGAKLRAMKAEAAQMRRELLAELEKPFHESLQSIPLTDDQKAKGPLGPAPKPTVLWLTDHLVQWGLVVIGAGLLLGALTRLCCLSGALFLITLYLAMPAWPWLPESTRDEGHYLFVTKNLIIAVALLALATTRSGRWFGLDGLLQFLNPWRYRAKAASVQSEEGGVALSAPSSR
jgi:uncharacterized membrane protein YphA (DoxX/SURF4 family)